MERVLLTVQVNHAQHALLDGVERVRRLARSGAGDLAAMEAVRALANGDGSTAPEPFADLLSDLAVLRFRVQDLSGARALLTAALEICAAHPLAQENLLDLTSFVNPPRSARRPTLAAILDSLGHAHPVRAAGDPLHDPLPWKNTQLQASDQSVSRMSGRLPPLGLSEALAEVRRALVPGGVAVLATPALWSGPAAPQLLYAEPDAPPTARVLPDWAHLLLEPREISWYLRITRGPLVARLLLEGWWATPSATEAAAREALGRSGLHILKLVPMLSFATPSTPLAAALRDASKDSARPRIERFAIALERRREDRHSA